MPQRHVYNGCKTFNIKVMHIKIKKTLKSQIANNKTLPLSFLVCFSPFFCTKSLIPFHSKRNTRDLSFFLHSQPSLLYAQLSLSSLHRKTNNLALSLPPQFLPPSPFLFAWLFIAKYWEVSAIAWGYGVM